jgi:hypothetical protein
MLEFDKIIKLLWAAKLIHSLNISEVTHQNVSFSIYKMCFVSMYVWLQSTVLFRQQLRVTNRIIISMLSIKKPYSI